MEDLLINPTKHPWGESAVPTFKEQETEAGATKPFDYGVMTELVGGRAGPGIGELEFNHWILSL